MLTLCRPRPGLPWVLEIIDTAAKTYEMHYEAGKSSSSLRLEVTISGGSVMCPRECCDAKVGRYPSHGACYRDRRLIGGLSNWAIIRCAPGVGDLSSLFPQGSVPPGTRPSGLVYDVQ